MTLERFLRRADGRPEASLVLVNREESVTVRRMLEDLFGDGSVDVSEGDLPAREREVVALVRDGSVVATSPLSDVMESVLLVNSDLFVTGARELSAAALPDAIRGLEDTRFEVRGYPASEREKFLLVAVSRAIEREAWRAGAGTLRAAFQRLSRIEDESGTRRVYERLADTDVDAHLYGVPDWRPPPSFDAAVHGGTGPDFRRAWFVVFRAPGGGGSALLAYETAPQQWSGFWTSRAGLVEDLNDYVARNM